MYQIYMCVSAYVTNNLINQNTIRENFQTKNEKSERKYEQRKKNYFSVDKKTKKNRVITLTLQQYISIDCCLKHLC